MPKYVIERTMPGAGRLSPTELQKVSKQSADVLNTMDQIEWLHSYVTNDKIYCVYYASNEDLIRKHAKEAGFPVDSISTVSAVIDMATAEETPVFA